ncbi:MAG TPA: NYN domain-containing protein [Allocoleopsis sp.]
MIINQVKIYHDLQNQHITKDNFFTIIKIAKSKGNLKKFQTYFNSHYDGNKVKHLTRLNNCYLQLIDCYLPWQQKNLIDNKLIENVYQDLKSGSVDIFILVVGDKDYLQLIKYLQSIGKEVIIFYTNAINPKLLDLGICYNLNLYSM